MAFENGSWGTWSGETQQGGSPQQSGSFGTPQGTQGFGTPASGASQGNDMSGQSFGTPQGGQGFGTSQGLGTQQGNGFGTQSAQQPQQNGSFTDNLRRNMENAQNTAKSVLKDVDSGLVTGLNGKSAFGFSLVLYGIMGYCMAWLGNSTCLLILMGFAFLVDKNKDAVRVLANVFGLYLVANVSYYIVYNGLSLIITILPNSGFLYNIDKIFSTLRTLISDVWDIAEVLLYGYGIVKAHKGGYLKIKYVDKLFD